MGSGDGNTDPSPASHRTTLSLTITSYPIALPTKFHFEILETAEQILNAALSPSFAVEASALVTPSAG